MDVNAYILFGVNQGLTTLGGRGGENDIQKGRLIEGPRYLDTSLAWRRTAGAVLRDGVPVVLGGVPSWFHVPEQDQRQVGNGPLSESPRM